MGQTSTMLGLMCLAQGHNAVTTVRLDPAASRSQVKHSTTEPLRSQHIAKALIRLCVCAGRSEPLLVALTMLEMLCHSSN